MTHLDALYGCIEREALVLTATLLPRQRMLELLQSYALPVFGTSW